LHFPSGNPYSERTWPELSWRSMLRHIYRQQRFWSDIADRQPESEQHAVLMLFLGLAEHMFSEQHGELVEKRKLVFKLQGAKDQFTKIMDTISKEVVDDDSLRAGLTADSIDLAVARLHESAAQAQKKRTQVLEDLRETSAINQATGASQMGQIETDRIGEAWQRLQVERDENGICLAKVENRLKEIQAYRGTINSELSRLNRVRGAGRVLSDLRITHCPACDQPVSDEASDPEHCFLCSQTLNHQRDEAAASEQRLQFEIRQLQAELAECDELIKSLIAEQQTRQQTQRRVIESIDRLASQLAPVRQASASILPPDISVLDMETGRLEEKARQVGRLKTALELRDRFAQEIDDLQHEVAVLEEAVKRHDQALNFEQKGDLIADGMNTYLNELAVASRQPWTQGRVDVRLKERDFTLTVDGGNWAGKLGGTLTYYFLFAYHYALLGLTPREGTHYPGLTILDLPATLEDGSSVADKENYVLEPFVRLVQRSDLQLAQVIAAGTAFQGLQGAHRIDLTRVWR
jgi:hypothetical protein